MSWIERAAVMRRSQFSTVILFETVDPQRIRQFITFVRDDISKEPTTALINAFNLNKAGTPLDPRLLLFDPWEGLIDLKTEGQVTGGTESPLDRVMGSGVMGLNTALRTADEMMKEKCTIFIIKNIATKQEPLLAALRSWTVHDDIFKHKSIVFIFAENASAVLDDYTKRLTAVVPIPVSTEEERKTIIEDLNEQFELEFDPALIQASAGLTLHDTEAALLMSYFTKRLLTTEELTHFKTEMIRKTGVLSFEQPKYGFESVGGYQSTKNFINDEIIALLKDPERVQAMGIRPPRGILLFGPPGTGKTLIARALARELSLPFINFRLEDIMRGIVGETEQRLRSAIDLIEELAPCIVFIDELDRLGQRSDVSTDSGVSRRVFSMLLEWLGQKERKSILVATTNEPEYLDDALMRPGRLDRKIPMMYPDADARKAIIHVHLNVVRKVPHGKLDVDFIIKKTEYFSGAEIEALILKAGRYALKEGGNKVLMKHFKAAIASYQLNLTERKKLLDKYLKLAEDYTDDKTFLDTLRIEHTSFDRAAAVKEEIEQQA